MQRWESTISANLKISMEKRIRKRSTKRTRALKQALKMRVFVRDNWTCYICGLRVRDLPNHPRMATVDHIIPRIKGGSNDMSNLKTCCAKCNNDKGCNSIN